MKDATRLRALGLHIRNDLAGSSALGAHIRKDLAGSPALGAHIRNDLAGSSALDIPSIRSVRQLCVFSISITAYVFVRSRREITSVPSGVRPLLVLSHQNSGVLCYMVTLDLSRWC